MDDFVSIAIPLLFKFIKVNEILCSPRCFLIFYEVIHADKFNWKTLVVHINFSSVTFLEIDTIDSCKNLDLARFSTDFHHKFFL